MARGVGTRGRRSAIAVAAVCLLVVTGCGERGEQEVVSDADRRPSWTQGDDHSWAVGMAATTEAIFSSDDHVQAGFVLSGRNGRERWRGLPPVPLHAPSIAAWEGRFVIAGERCRAYRMVDGEPLCPESSGMVLTFDPADRSWAVVVEDLGSEREQLGVEVLGVIEGHALVEMRWWGGRELVDVELRTGMTAALPDPPVEGYSSDSVVTGLGACVIGSSVLVAGVTDEAPAGASIESASYSQALQVAGPPARPPTWEPGRRTRSDVGRRTGVCRRRNDLDGGRRAHHNPLGSDRGRSRAG